MKTNRQPIDEQQRKTQRLLYMLGTLCCLLLLLTIGSWYLSARYYSKEATQGSWQPPSPRDWRQPSSWLKPRVENAFLLLPPSSGYLRGAAASPNRKTICFVGDGGQVIWSLNRGETWMSKSIGRSIHLFAVDFVDDSKAFAVGSGGVIYSLILKDDLEARQVYKDRSNRTLRDVVFNGEREGYAVGDEGALLGTTDGGQNWIFHPATKRHLHAVTITPEKAAYAAGDGKTILKSKDGRTWRTIVSARKGEEGLTIYDIKNVGDRLFAVGKKGLVLVLRKDTDTANQISHRPDATLTNIALADTNTLWIAADKGRLFRTNVGGEKWFEAGNPAGGWLLALHFLDDKTGFAAGQDGVILATTDGGNNWRNILRETLVPFHSVAVANRSRAWIAGGKGVILATEDGGRTWQRQPTGTESDLYKIAFANESKGWAAGANGVILKTADGGKNWKTVSTRTKETLHGLAILDGDARFAVGTSGTILHSSDGGETWIPHSQSPFGTNPVEAPSGNLSAPGSPGDLYSVQFSANASLGWIVGSRGTILKTTDGGEQWEAVPIGNSNRTFFEIVPASPSLALAVGQDFAIVEVSEGGVSEKSPFQSSAPAPPNLYTIARSPDAQDLWIAGARGTVFKYPEANQMRISEKLTRRRDLRAIGMAGGLMIAAGADGAILYSHDGGEKWQTVEPQKRESPFPAALFVATVLCVFLTVIYVHKFPSARDGKYTAAPSKGPREVLANDMPLPPYGLDKYGHFAVARTVARILRNSETQPGFVFSVTGPWGSGKTTVLEKLQDELKNYNFRTVWYNAWHHQVERRPLTSLLDTIRRNAFEGSIGLRVRYWIFRVCRHPRLVTLWVALLLVSAVLLHLDANAYREASRKNTVGRIVRRILLLEPPVRIYVRQDNWRPIGSERLDLEELRKMEFESRRQFFASLEKVLERSLTDKEKGDWESGLGAVEVPLPAGRLLEIVGGGLLVLLIAQLHLLGRIRDLQRLLRNVFPRLEVPDAEPIGTVERYRRDFELLTEFLRGRLLILVDDLDRCDDAVIREFASIINYLASNGKCFIVVATAMERLIDAFRAEGDGTARDNRFLEKVLNMYIRVPTGSWRITAGGQQEAIPTRVTI